MVSPINSLTNMEYMLYGGASGVNPNCPSFSNGYMANRNSWNYQMPYAYNNQSVWNNQFTPQGYGNSSVAGNDTFSSNASANQTGFGASSRDLDTLGKYYLKGMEPSESMLGAAGGGAAFALLNNTRFIAHPFNSLSSIGKVEKMFADVKKEGSALNKLWSNPETTNIMRDAYYKMHKLEGASKSRLGLFKARLDENTYNTLKKEMELALKSGNKVQIAKVSEKIRIATGAKTGYIPKAWSKITGHKSKTIAERMPVSSDLTQIAKKKVAEAGEKTTFSKFLKEGVKSQKGFGGLLFGAMEFVCDWSKIKSAFSKDNKTGAKQIGQTSVKAAGSIVGWTVGEAAGAWAGAKIGAALGTAIAPGVGTAIGAVAGLIGGSIGTWAMGKVTKAIVGEDVGSKAEVEKMKKTAHGQAQLLQLTAQQAQDDKKLDPKVAQALQNVIGQYSAVA